MIKALRVVMIVFGAIGILAGLSDMIVPDQVAKLYGFGEIADYVRWISALGGASFVAAAIWVIVASRDPIRHINWVKFEITKSLLFTAVTAYSIIQGYVSFSQVGALLILFAIFAVLFLVFYPWRVKVSTQ
jgi:Ca2+/Na+ antiporter